MLYVASNTGTTTLAAAISSSTQTSITLATGTGSRFPSPTGGNYTLVTLELGTTKEIVSIVGRSGDTLTVGIAGSDSADAAGRGLEGTTATTWSIGDLIECRNTAAIIAKGANSEASANKDATGGYAGLTLFKLNLRNTANTITSWFTTAATVARTWTMPNKDGTVAMTSDITGTNSGTNTGDNATNAQYSGLAASKANLAGSSGQAFNTAALGVTGNITLNGSARRISGDFSDAILSNRVSFQTNVTNGITRVQFLPNGSAVDSGLQVHNSSDTLNSGLMKFLATSTEGQISFDKIGTGSYLPISFLTSNVEGMRLGVSGVLNCYFGLAVAAGQKILGDFSDLTIGNRTAFQTTVVNGNTLLTVIPNGTGTSSGINLSSTSDPSNAVEARLVSDSNSVNVISYARGTGVFKPLNLQVNNLTALTCETTGKVTIPYGLLNTGTGGIGYGVGAGGTVTQATSKSTSVTLNKLSGRVTTHAESMLNGAYKFFVVNCNVLEATDDITLSPYLGAVNPKNYQIMLGNKSANQFEIRVLNISGGSLSEALEIDFQIHKGSIT